ncbi:MAG: TRAP transporter large permease [Succiniclasticum sp.]|jgi:tripartite ATP-independent transporter DctM subunit|uniref:TRAP transporter, DctM subunit n=1 Tax=Succiniclasticum ruminis TaxID=40841 RepID=A0A1G6L388_9FIRM|nr:TRAP transporter large permease [Succiniclasticum ruminis]MEE3396932.1 TRAP transporter large permease [Succiniclasticum sp.]SDC37789.1 TRAP transporter, DctM subunit [Succiniclasticum ruminis]
MSDVLMFSSVAMLVLLFLKVPVFVAVLGGSLIYFLMNPDINSLIFAQQMILGTEKISLLAIPFFVCAGIVMNYTGVTKRIMDFCEIVTAHLPGGLAQVNVLLSTVMGGLSGSNLADAAMEAKMLIPEMTRKGFSLSFSSVVTAASSMITPLIPPGIAMILYGCIANVSIGKLFISGIGVGSLLCISMMILVGIISKKRNYGALTQEKLTYDKVMRALKPAFLPLLLPIIIIGGIRVGIFTATEAGAVAILYAVLLGFLYRDMKASDLVRSLKETVASTSSIMLIVSAASVYSWILTRERVPQMLTEWMLQTIDSKFVFLIAVNIFLLFVGMFIEGNASMIILVPLLAPIAAQYGVNEIQFAMIYIFNNAIGALSPPMGTLMFVTCSISKCPTAAFIKEAIPFYILLAIDLLLITYCEPFTTFLVNLVY